MKKILIILLLFNIVAFAQVKTPPIVAGESENALLLQGQNGAYYLDLGNSTGSLGMLEIDTLFATGDSIVFVSGDSIVFKMSNISNNAILTIASNPNNNNNNSNPVLNLKRGTTETPIFINGSNGQDKDYKGDVLTNASPNDFIIHHSDGQGIQLATSGSVKFEVKNDIEIFESSIIFNESDGSNDGNVKLGSNTLSDITVGQATYNIGIGSATLQSLTTGDENIGIGDFIGLTLTTGDQNICIGSQAGQGLDLADSENTIIGDEAGKNNSGSGNVFIGKDAGLNATGDNQLFIDNSSTATPLILGDFASNEIDFNADVDINGNGEVLVINNNVSNAGYIAFREDGVRKGYFGDGSSTNNHMVLAADGAGNDLIFQVNGSNDALTVRDDGFVKFDNGTYINEFSIDGTLAGDSDDAVPTEKAIRTFYEDSIKTVLDLYSGAAELIAINAIDTSTTVPTGDTIRENVAFLIRHSTPHFTTSGDSSIIFTCTKPTKLDFTGLIDFESLTGAFTLTLMIYVGDTLYLQAGIKEISLNRSFSVSNAYGSASAGGVIDLPIGSHEIYFAATTDSGQSETFDLNNGKITFREIITE